MSNTNSRSVDIYSPIEVWLSPNHPDSDLTGYRCMVVFSDESIETLSSVVALRKDGDNIPRLARDVEPESLSLRGAQREVTATLIDVGYTPAGRWQSEHQDREETIEASRTFRLAKSGDS